jgi:hypothetical protein
MKKVLLFPILFYLLLSTNNAVAQKPCPDNLEGQVGAHYITAFSCYVTNIYVKYRLGCMVGEPTVYFNIKWDGKSSTDECLANENFELYLKANTSSGSFYIPTGGSNALNIGNGNGQWGSNPLAGSPNWDKTFKQSINGNFLDAERSKKIWKYGFSIAAAFIVTSSGKIIELH